MDIRDRVMGDQPNSFLHKIAGIVPGYTGYVDRERRRDADKLLRMHVARQYTAQRDRLNRVQQQMARSRNLEQIAEVDRLVGTLQRFIDRLQTATYGYTGLFDPVKVEAAELDQLYAFDMALATGVDKLSGAIDSLENRSSGAGDSEGRQEGRSGQPDALAYLSSTVDELNARLNERTDLLSTGRLVSEESYRNMVSELDRPPTAGYAGGYPNTQGNVPGSQSPGSPAALGTPSTAGRGAGGEMARVGGAGAEVGSGGVARYPSGSQNEPGTPTTNLNSMGAGAPPNLGSSLDAEGAGLPGYGAVSSYDTGAGSETTPGIESASSPVSGHGMAGSGDVIEGLEDMAGKTPLVDGGIEPPPGPLTRDDER